MNTIDAIGCFPQNLTRSSSHGWSISDTLSSFNFEFLFLHRYLCFNRGSSTKYKSKKDYHSNRNNSENDDKLCSG